MSVNSITSHANVRESSAIEISIREELEAVTKAASVKLLQGTVKNAQSLSAELNSLVHYLQEKKAHPQDFHYLLCTDTWLGEQAANIIARWIQKQYPGSACDVHRQVDLQTEEIEAFQIALSDVASHFAKVIPQFRENGYEIVFNLTGGFKSVQGFLQSIANVYADETVYKFEGADALLRIPRLPVRLDGESVIREEMADFRNMHLQMFDGGETNLPETLLFRVNGKLRLSAWGEMLWGECFKSLYREKLWPSPRPDLLRYGDKFCKTVEKLSEKHLLELNEKIDLFIRYLTSRDFNLNSLDVKPLFGDVMRPSTHEFDVWHDGAAGRVFFHYEEVTGVRIAVLDAVGQPLH